MENKPLLGRLVRSRAPRSTRNQTPKHTWKLKDFKAKSPAKKPRVSGRTRRTKTRLNVKLTEAQRISILEVLNKDLRFSKDATNIASSESIMKLAKKMKVPSFVVCDWLGITDELNEIFALCYLTKEQIDSTVEMFATVIGSSENVAEDGTPESRDKVDVAPIPEETLNLMEITNDSNEVSVCSDHETRSESSSSVKLTGVQKDSILGMLKKDLDSNRRVLSVGNAKHIRELADKMEVSTKDLREWLGITDDLNQVIANSKVKVRGLECQTEALEAVTAARKEGFECKTKALEEVVAALKEKFLETEDDLKVIAEIYQEPEEELTPKLAQPIPADEEGLVLESSKSIDEDVEKFLAEMDVSVDDFLESAPESTSDIWTEELQEYLNVSPAYEDGNALECEMLLTVVGNKPSEMEVDMDSHSQKQPTEAPAVGPSESNCEPKLVIKRKSRIDDYFPALKSIKHD